MTGQRPAVAGLPSPLGALRARLAQGPRPRVICVGHTALDLTWQVASLPQGGGKTRASAFRQGGGGMAATAAVAVARLGGESRFWGRAGDDWAGAAMASELHGHGVDVQQLRRFAGARSSVSAIVVDADGERSIVNHRGEALPDAASWLPLHQVASADAVLADPRWPEGAAALLAAARAAGVTTVLDGDVTEDGVFDRLLPWVDVAVFSQPGLAGCAPAAPDDEARLLEALRRGCRVAAVTQGERGGLWTDGSALHRFAACPVSPVVDTTGAGDVFHGALALALAAATPLPAALGFAAAAAALKCRQGGARAGIPTADEVFARLCGGAGRRAKTDDRRDPPGVLPCHDP